MPITITDLATPRHGHVTIDGVEAPAMSDPASPTERLARAFLERTLPKAQWTHEAHLRVGLWHVVRFGRAGALDRLRGAIRAYNAATGGANTETSGYHETITRFYVGLIADFVARADATRTVDELADALVATCGGRDLPHRHWSPARLSSPEARRAWVGPDLRPLDWDEEDGTTP
jgi:hypothetical protein